MNKKDKFNLRVIKGRDADLNLLKQLTELDKKVFEEPYWTNYDLALSWHNKNKDVFTFLMDDNKLIGYLCILPIADKMYSRIKNDLWDTESEIIPDYIEKYKSGKIYNLYFYQVGVLPEYRGTSAKSMLFTSASLQLFNKFLHAQIPGKFLAATVTPKGEQICIDLGLKKLNTSCEECTYFEINTLSLISTIFSKKLIKEINKVKDYFFKPSPKILEYKDLYENSNTITNNNLPIETNLVDNKKVKEARFDKLDLINKSSLQNSNLTQIKDKPSLGMSL